MIIQNTRCLIEETLRFTLVVNIDILKETGNLKENINGKKLRDSKSTINKIAILL